MINETFWKTSARKKFFSSQLVDKNSKTRTQTTSSTQQSKQQNNIKLSRSVKTPLKVGFRKAEAMNLLPSLAFSIKK